MIPPPVIPPRPDLFADGCPRPVHCYAPDVDGGCRLCSPDAHDPLVWGVR